jgi:hypothetical protein
VYASGSYRNNTNIRLGSDIDVAIVLTSAMYCEYPASGLPSRELLGMSTATYGLVSFRDDVGLALKAKFGSAGVTAGDKTFNVHENSYRLDADATVFCGHRRYTGKTNADGSWHYYEGVETRSRSNPDKSIVNWHQAHYDEGVARNTQTKRRFKRITRIIKRLRDDMIVYGVPGAVLAAKPMASFLIECLVFNATDDCFNREEGSYYEDTKAVIKWLYAATSDDVACKELLEVSRFKYLFRSTQPWSRVGAHEFLRCAWQHVGFGQ